MENSKAIQNEDEWKTYRGSLTPNPSWMDASSSPDKYPCICVPFQNFSPRYAETFVVYNFVYLEDFIDADSELLGKLVRRYHAEVKKEWSNRKGGEYSTPTTSPSSQEN